MAPLAQLVFRQEKLEGNFRSLHCRVRASLADVHLNNSGAAELLVLNTSLSNVLGNQARVVLWRWVLHAVATTLDYAGSLLNYCCIAYALLGVVSNTSGDGGQRASKVSVASFATLTLIYTFTEILDLSDKFSEVAGLTGRVGQLLEALQRSETSGPSESELRAAEVALQGTLLSESHSVFAFEEAALSLSVLLLHLSDQALEQLTGSKYDRSHRTPVLAVVLTSEASAADGSPCGDALHRRATSLWQDCTKQHVEAVGYWCAVGSVVDCCEGQPSSLSPLHALLEKCQNLSGLQHTRRHFSYGWVLSDSPLQVLQALSLPAPWQGTLQPLAELETPGEHELLWLRRFCCQTKGGQWVVRNLTFSLQQGSSALLLGKEWAVCSLPLRLPVTHA